MINEMTKSIILQRVSATAQFILGFIIGISLIIGVSGGLVFAYYKKMSVLPKKPDFPEPVESASIEDEAESATTIEPLESNTSLEEEAVVPEPEPAPEPELELPPNSYYATVTWPEGLSLRAEPSADAERIGGIQFDNKIVILEDSADGRWQRVMLPWNQQEGWVKAGNVERVE